MESKKINQLATAVNPSTSDLAIIGDPVTGVSKKITWLQVSTLIGTAANLQQVTDNGATTTNPVTIGGLTITGLSTGVLKSDSGVISSVPFGAANGVATLAGDGKVPSSQLPSYVDDVVEVANYAALPVTGETGKIYITLDNNKVYRWGGSVYVEVAANQAVWGSITGTLANQTDLQNALDAKANDSAVVHLAGTETITGTKTFSNPSKNDGGVLLKNGASYSLSGYMNLGGMTDGLRFTSGGGISNFFTLPSSVGYTYTFPALSGTIVAISGGNSTQYIDGTGALQTFPTLLSSDNLVKLVRNQSGATMTAGTIVYISGATGNKPLITKALATGDSTSAQTYGLVQADIANNADGYVVIIGNVNDIDTSALTEGQQLYLSGTTAGAYTTTKPYAPIHLVYVGIVLRSHPTQGIIGVKIQNGYELDELHDVSAQSPSNNDGIFFNTSTSLWEKKSIATALGFTPISLASLSATSPLSYNNSTGAFSIQVATASQNGYLSSTDWSTFNNKQAALGGTGFVKISGSTISYDNSTYYLASNPSAYITLTSLSAGDGISYSNTTGVISSTITQYTDALARAAISSSATGLTYTSSTGVFSLTAGYAIPTTAKQTEWDTAYTNRITSLTTTGTSGVATLVANTLNIPNYGSALTGYVPYTGATAGVDLGANSLTATSLLGKAIFATNSVGTSGGLISLSIGSTFSSYVGHNTISAAANGIFVFLSDISSGTTIKDARFNFGSLTNGTTRTYTFPDATGTLALTSDIVTYTLPIATASVLGGVKIGSGVSVDVNGVISVSTNYQAPLNGTGFVKASGTTITYDNSTYVTTNTAQTISGTKTFSASPIIDSGLATAIPLRFKQYDSASFNSDGYTDLYVMNAYRFGFAFNQGSSNYKGFTFNVNGITLNTSREYTMPNASGTLALTSDIPSLSGYVTGSGTANKIAKFTSTGSVIGNSLITDNGSGVSINNSTISYLFNVHQAADVWHMAIGDVSSTGQMLRIGGNALSGTTKYSVIGSYLNNTGATTSLLVLQRDGGNVIIGGTSVVSDSGDLLQVKGNAVIRNDYNGLTRLNIVNTTAGASAYVETSYTTNATGNGAIGKYSTTTTAYKIITASNTYLYNGGSGDLAILNDFATGAIKMAAGGSSTAHLTIASTGAATFASTIAASNLSGTNTGDQTLAGLNGFPLSGGTITGFTRFQYDNSYVALNRSAVNKYIGVLYETNDVNQWFVGLRELNTNHYYIYNEVEATNALIINVANNNATFGGTITATNFSGSSSGTNTGDQTLAGLGGVPTSRTLTINGTAYDLSADRSWTISGTSGVTLDTAQTITGKKIFSNAFGDNDPVIALTGTATTTFQYITTAYNASISADQTIAHFIGRSSSQKNSGYYGYQWRSSGSDNNFLTIGHYMNDHTFRHYASGRSVITATAASLLDFAGPVQSFMINGAAGDGAMTINSSASGYAYINFSQALTSKFEIGIVGTSGNGSFYINRNIQVGETGASLYINKSNGYVGILANNPSYTLDVGGDIRGGRLRNIGSLTLSSYQSVNPASNVMLYSTPNDRDMWIMLDSADTTSNWGMYYRQIDAALAIAGQTTLPANSVAFVGSGSNTLQAYICLADGTAFVKSTFTAGGDVIAFSDISVKENIRPIKNVIERITNSRGILYDRIDTGTKDNIGFVAQELEVQFPELVKTNPNGTKSVAYQNAVAVLFEAIKEQQNQINNLKKQLV